MTRWLALVAERFTRQRLEALAHARDRAADMTPGVLFVCVHNAARSQMALGWFTRLAAGRAVAWSACTAPSCGPRIPRARDYGAGATRTG